ncbi:MAG TPA: PDZ domain-containing protein [Thermoanaerobaculia bacterium]|nr:PDZ domain-containing protein [Thermoanaerobaculia bacterium]
MAHRFEIRFPARALAAGLALLLSAASAARGAGEPAPPSPKTPDGERRVFTVRTAGHGLLGEGRAAEGMLLGKGYLGIELLELTPELLEHFGVKGDHGILVSRIDPGSPAEKAGVLVGDIVTEVAGEPIDSPWAIRRQIRAKEAGEQVALDLWRDGRPLKVQATVAERERSEIDLAPMFFKRRDGKDVLLELDPDRMARGFEAFEGSAGDGDGKRVIRLRSREGELENRLKQLEKRIGELEHLLAKK